MDFILNESQQELAALAGASSTDQATPQRLREVEAGGDRFDPALWADLASAGILAAALPESLGGAGLGPAGAVLGAGPRSAGPWPRCRTWPRSCSAPARWPGSARRTSRSAGRRPRAAANSSSRPRWPRRTATTPAPRRPRAERTGRGRVAADRHEDRGARGAAGRPDPGARRDRAGPRRVPGRAGRPRRDASEPQRLVDGDVAGRLELAGVELARRPAARRPADRGARSPAGWRPAAPSGCARCSSACSSGPWS